MDLEKRGAGRNREGGPYKWKLFIKKSFNSFDTVHKQKALQNKVTHFSNLF